MTAPTDPDELDRRTVATITAAVERLLGAPDGERLTSAALAELDDGALRQVATQLAAGLALLVVQSAAAQNIDPHMKVRRLARAVLGG